MNYPQSQFRCLNPDCQVTVYGRMLRSRALETCPRCKTYNVAICTRAEWVASMIVGEQLKAGMEYPQA